MKKETKLYFLILAFTALGLGLTNNLISNFFKDAYAVSAYQRGLLEFPREIPGIITIFVLAGLAFWNDIRVSIIAQILSFIGIIVLGFVTPTYGLMIFFVWLNSMGMHMFFILQDSIGMRLADPEKLGKRLGQFKGLFTAFQMVAAIIAFLGFKYGWMRFDQPFKLSFVLAGILFGVVVLLLIPLDKMTKWPGNTKKNSGFIYRKTYNYYYVLVILYGMQKQIMLVYGPWVLIDLLNKKADTLSLLTIAGSFAGIFFIPALGRWIDKYGVKKLLFADAWSYIVIYIIYGLVCAGFISGRLPKIGIGLFLAYGIFIADRMSTQMGIIRTVYLKQIAVVDSDVTPTLSLGQSLDHFVSIIIAYLGGLVWVTIGPQYVFYITAALSLINVYVAYRIQEPKGSLREV